MGVNPLLLTGVFMIGMAVGAFLMKIRITNVAATIVLKELEGTTSSAIRGQQSVS